jgi:hypothetical protein
MRITVIGGCGAWPAAGQACSGYLVEQDSFLLLVDPGYATLPRLLEVAAAERIDAVLVSHDGDCSRGLALLLADSTWIPRVADCPPSHRNPNREPSVAPKRSGGMTRALHLGSSLLVACMLASACSVGQGSSPGSQSNDNESPSSVEPGLAPTTHAAVSGTPR